MSGRDLLTEVTSMTDLPQEPLLRELVVLLEKARCCQENLSLEELRLILADYAQDVLVEAQSAYSEKVG